MTAANPQRWTPSAVRKETPFPKPRGAIAGINRLLTGGDLLPRHLDPFDRKMVRWLIHYADLIDLGSAPEFVDRGKRVRVIGERRWLLIPATDEVLDWMAAFESDRDDDLGVDRDLEPDEYDEPSLSGLEDMDQTQWSRGDNDGWRDEAERDYPDDEPFFSASEEIDQTLWSESPTEVEACDADDEPDDPQEPGFGHAERTELTDTCVPSSALPVPEGLTRLRAQRTVKSPITHETLGTFTPLLRGAP